MFDYDGGKDDSTLVYEPLGPEDFKKTAGYDIELSRNTSEWPMEITKHFAMSHPFAYVDKATNVEFQKMDDKTGNAFGAIIITLPYQTQGYEARERLQQEPQKIAVPVVIDNFQLRPFDVFIVGDKVLPLTEKRFGEASTTGKIAAGLDPYMQASPVFIDKMMPPTVGYLGNLYGNYSLSGGERDYGSWSPIKTSSDKTAGSANPQHESSLIKEIKGTIQKADYDSFRDAVGRDERIMSSFGSNKTMNIIKELVGTKPTTADDYMDFIHGAAPTHLIYVKGLTNGKFRVTEWSDYFFRPSTKEMAIDELVAKYGKLEPSIVRMSYGAEGVLLEVPGRTTTRPLILEDLSVTGTEDATDGHYVVCTKGGGFVEGQVFSKVKNYDKNDTPFQLFATGGAWSICDKIVGHRLGDIYPNLKEGSVEVGAEGTFICVEEDDDGNETGFVLMPFKVTNVSKVYDYWVVQALGQALEQLTFVVMPGISKYNNVTGVAEPSIGTHAGGNIYYVPVGCKFINLGKKIDVEKSISQINRYTKRKMLSGIHGDIFLDNDHRGLDRSLRIICQHGNEHRKTLVGRCLETIRRDTYLDYVSNMDAMCILAQLGCSVSDAASICTRACEEGEICVTNLRPAKDAVTKNQIYDPKLIEIASVIRRNVIKEAATMADEESVDALLSLNFVNETNLIEFIRNLPKFQNVESKLAELLLYTRLGLKNRIPEQAVYSAMVNMNEVNEHLEHLDSMLRQQAVAAPAQTQMEESQNQQQQ